MRLLTIFLIALVVSVAARAQSFDADATQLVLNRSHVVTVKVEKKNAVITMESISDFTESPNDYAGIRLDANNNNLVDERTDLAFGIANGTRAYCPQFLYKIDSSSGCGQQASAGRLRVKFERSAYQDLPHPIFIFTIPVAELTAAGNTVGFVFTFYNNGSPTHYPHNRPNPRAFTQTVAHTF